MKTKIIPFDLETAKKIQAGEIEGNIKARNGSNIRIICFDRKEMLSIVALVGRYENVVLYRANGRFQEKGKNDLDIVLEVLDDETQFKPFDRVLVRDRDGGLWHPSLYATTDGLLYYTIDCKNWCHCIPYEGNEELVGTTNKPKEE